MMSLYNNIDLTKQKVHFLKHPHTIPLFYHDSVIKWSLPVSHSRLIAIFLVSNLLACKTPSAGTSALATVTRIPGLTSEPSSVSALPGAPDTFLTSTWTGDVTRWSLVAQRPTWTVSFGKKINHIEPSADGRFIYVAGSEGLVRILNASDGQEVKNLDLPTRGSAVRTNVSPDGRKLAAAFLDLSLIIYDVERGVVTQTLTEMFRWPIIRAINFSADGNRLLLADLIAAKEVDLLQGVVLRTFRDERHCTQNNCPPWLSAAATSADRRLLAIGSMSDVRLYDTESGRELVTLGHHIGEVTSLSFLDNDRRLESIGLDGSSMSWTIPGLNLLALHATQQHRIWQSVVTSDNKFLIGVDRENFDITISTFDDTAGSYTAYLDDKWMGRLRVDSQDDASIRLSRGSVSSPEVACVKDAVQQCSTTQYCFRCPNQIQIFIDGQLQLGKATFYQQLSNGALFETSLRCTKNLVGPGQNNLYDCLEATSI